MSEVERIDSGPLVHQTYDRMVEIMALITPTQAASPQVEYSAMMCAAAIIMAAASGLEPTNEHCQRIMHLMAECIVPAIEAAVEKLT